MATHKKPQREVIDSDVSALIPDNRNYNKGTEYGQHLMDKSFREFGAGRAILLDKDNRVIAGNKSLQTFADIGMDKVRIIESDGTELIAVKRVDVSLDSKKGREMALADNATAKANLDFDLELMQEDADEFGFNPDDWGVELNDGDDVDMQEDKQHKDLSNDLDSLFQIVIDCESERDQEQIYNELKDKYRCRVLTL